MDMKKFKGAYFILITLAIGFCHEIAGATDGHQLIGIGPNQKGTAGAGVASAEDSTWTLLNPASIVELDERLDFTFEVFAPRRSMTPTGPNLEDLHGNPLANTQGGTLTDNSMFYIPTIGMIFKGAGDDRLGIGLYGVNGMGVNYKLSRTTIPSFTGENFDRRTEYSVAKLALAYAHNVTDSFSVGVALNGDMARFRTDMLTSKFSGTTGDWNYDTSFGFGFELGVEQRWEDFRIGASYSSRQWMQTLSKYEDWASRSLDLPQMIQAGIAYRVTEKLDLLTDYKFINWSTVKQLGLKPSEGGFGWSDTGALKIGARYNINDDLKCRMGFSFGESPISSDDVFANALFPAIVDRHATAGVSYKLTDHSDINVAYHHAFRKNMKESGTGDMYSQAGKGTEISLLENTLTLGYGYRF